MGLLKPARAWNDDFKQVGQDIQDIIIFFRGKDCGASTPYTKTD